LGSGNDFRYSKDWVNLDITRPCNVVADIRDGLPFKNSSLDMVWASHILEHLPDLRMMQLELARVLKHKGVLQVIVPYYLSPDSWGDPTHCRAFSEESFFTCFWVGFTVVSMETKSYTKRGTGNKVLWLHVKMVRNEVELHEVKQEIGGNNFNKVT
jgi:SAM-dependent methyltransferase